VPNRAPIAPSSGSVPAVKALRIVAFLAALGAFVFQIIAAGDDGVNALPIVLGTFAATAVFIWALVTIARRQRQRRLAPPSSPNTTAGTPPRSSPHCPSAHPPERRPRPQGPASWLLSSAGVELLGGDGARAPYEHLLAAPWTQVNVTAARVQYIAGRAFTKPGLTLEVAGLPTHQVVVIPERSLRARFPEPSAPERVLAAMRARHQFTGDAVGS